MDRHPARADGYYEKVGLMELIRWQKLKRVFPLLLAFSLLLSGCSLTGTEPGPLDPRGETGQEQLTLILLSTGIMLFVMVVVFVLFFYVIIRFRQRKGDTEIPKQVEGNHKLEIIWTVIPILLLTILAIPTVAFTFKQATDYTEDPDAMLVKVTAHQFWWEFEYPDYGIFTAQDLVIPVNTTIQFELTASDVLHSFWVPALGGKMDTLTGITNKMYLKAEETGVFKGKCAELCGASHALMDFKVVVYTQEEFDAWVAKMQEPVVVSEDVARGQEVFKSKCMACHAVDSSIPSIGPNLDGFASRQVLAGYLPNTDEWLVEWLTATQELKEGTTMPQVPLTDEEVEELVKYLRSLK